ncbi:hypothetical protein [Nocardia arthritidis]|uniref:Uncharacterized protein n=1 Tax=Nocardia arthritidis TaxID=228602 RepID=A0A6G9YTD1_9NOCA|nr:hypothetical protein [Nocardia arthritidis]QIS16585.1 hypothetical protein F5544_43910 [Nocardia arthritidis]
MTVNQARAVAPAVPITDIDAPKSSVTQLRSPLPPVTVLAVEVPVIRPYLVAAFGGGGSVVTGLNGIRSSPIAGATAAGTLGGNQSWWLAMTPAGGAIGAADAKIAIKSGRVLLGAAPASTGQLDAVISVAKMAGATTEGAIGIAYAVIDTADAPFNMEGHYSGQPPLTIAGGGEGTLSTVTGLTGIVLISGNWSAAGGLGAVVAVGAQSSGVTTGSLSAQVSLPGIFSGMGALTLSATPVGTAAAAPLAEGTLSADARSSFQPSSMIKANKDWPLTNQWTTIPDWAPDTNGYPGSSVQSNGLVVQNAKAGADIVASVVFSGTAMWNNATARLQLYLNTQLLATSDETPIQGNASVTVRVTAKQTVAPNDVITVKGLGSGVYPPAAKVGAASYVRVS